MKTKLHFGILVVLLAFLGTFSGVFLERNIGPNQQIIIKFSDKAVGADQSASTVAIVKKQLEVIGITDLQIEYTSVGQLRITYYSHSNVERIKSVFSNVENFNLTHQSNQDSSTDFPEQKSLIKYELNISEIQNSNPNNHLGFDGIQITEFNHKSDHSYYSKVKISAKQVNTKQSNSISRLAIKVNNSITSLIDGQSYNIPEVRAGPIS